MTPDFNDDPCAPATGELPDALRWELRALRRDELPSGDLWSTLEPRLGPRSAMPAPTRTPWLALAASLLLVVGIAGLWRGQALEPVGAPTAIAEARRLSSDYRQALDEMPADAAARSRAFAPALAELDRSADEIRRALARDPDSQLLLEQLRRTYTRRLELSQRALVG
jgi:hypothetical protein